MSVVLALNYATICRYCLAQIFGNASVTMTYENYSRNILSRVYYC